jgi:hypothetical protein
MSLLSGSVLTKILFVASDGCKEVDVGAGVTVGLVVGSLDDVGAGVVVGLTDGSSVGSSVGAGVVVGLVVGSTVGSSVGFSSDGARVLGFTVTSGLGSKVSKDGVNVNEDEGSKVLVGGDVNEGVGKNEDGMNVGASVRGEGFLVGRLGLLVGSDRGDGALVGLAGVGLAGIGLFSGVGLCIGFLRRL